MGFSRQEYWSGLPLPSRVTLLQSLIIYRTIHLIKLLQGLLLLLLLSRFSHVRGRVRQMQGCQALIGKPKCWRLPLLSTASSASGELPAFCSGLTLDSLPWACSKNTGLRGSERTGNQSEVTQLARDRAGAWTHLQAPSLPPYPVLWKLYSQIPLAFKGRFPGDSQFFCQIPRLGSLMWGLEPSQPWEKIFGITVLWFVGRPRSTLAWKIAWTE